MMRRGVLPVIVTVLLVAVFLPGRLLACEPGKCCPQSSTAVYVSTLLERMGLKQGEIGSPPADPGMVLDVLKRNRTEAVACLASELRVVPFKRLVGGCTLGGVRTWEQELRYHRVLWNLRALRYVTGVDFCAAPREPPRPRLLDRMRDIRALGGRDCPDPDTVPFFRTWVSRNIHILAPRDVQEEIIRAWQDFAAGREPMLPRRRVGHNQFDSDDWQDIVY